MSVTDREVRANVADGDGEGDLVDYLETQIGGALRCVVEYDETGWDVVHSRDAVRREAFEPVVEEMKLRVRMAGGEHGRSSDVAPRTAVSCHETLSVVHVLDAGSRNVAVVVDDDATPKIRAFADACRDRLAE